MVSSSEEEVSVLATEESEGFEGFAAETVCAGMGMGRKGSGSGCDSGTEGALPITRGESVTDGGFARQAGRQMWALCKRKCGGAGARSVRGRSVSVAEGTRGG